MMRLLAPLANIRMVQKFLASRSTPRFKPPYLIENEFFAVGLNLTDRTLSITDKVSGKVLHGLNRFVDNGDCGDEYNFSPPMTDLQVDSTMLEKVTILCGPVQQTMTVALIMKVPASLGPDRKSRSEEMVEIPIKTTVTLTSGVPRIDIHTFVDNRAKDHRLRVHFPAPIQVESADYDGHFEIVKRPVGIPAYDATWAEEPRPETHQRVFTTIADQVSTLTVANRGLPEVEVLQAAGKEGTQIAITLLRCVSWLSRDDFSTRKSHAGPFLETTSAQMLGEWEFDYSIIPGQAANKACHQAWSFDAPLRTATTGIHKGSLPASGSFIQVENPSFVVSAVKETEDRRGWILRGYNIRDEDITVSLKPWRRFRKADYANMAEKPVKPLKVDKSGGVSTRVRGHEILTIMFRD
jgi:alpha-mannosidase